MQIETLNCNSCGAPLSVPDTANYITCNHCSTRLVIRRTSSTTFTEQLDQIESKQDELLDKLSTLERQNQLAQVDRQWDRERERYLVTNKQGHRREPNRAAAIMSGILVLAFGIFWMVVVTSKARSPSFSLFGLVFIIIGLAVSILNYNRSAEFRRAQRRYYQRRREIISGLEKSTQSFDPQQIPTPEEYLKQLSRDEKG